MFLVNSVMEHPREFVVESVATVPHMPYAVFDLAFRFVFLLTGICQASLLGVRQKRNFLGERYEGPLERDTEVTHSKQQGVQSLFPYFPPFFLPFLFSPWEQEPTIFKVVWHRLRVQAPEVDSVQSPSIPLASSAIP